MATSKSPQKALQGLRKASAELLKTRMQENRESQYNHEELSQYSIYGLKRGDTKPSHKAYFGACHSYMSAYDKIEVLVTSPNVQHWRTKEGYGAGRGAQCVRGTEDEVYQGCVMWWEWLVNASPWAPVFLEKSLEVAEATGVQVNCDLPSNYVMQALIASREPHEYTGRVALWADVVNAGGDPLGMAVLMEETQVKLQKNGDDKFLVIEKKESGDIHDMFSVGEMNAAALTNLFRGVQKKKNPPLTVSGRYHGVFGLWGDGPGSPVRKVIASMPTDATIRAQKYQPGKGYFDADVPCTTYQTGVDYLVEQSVALRKKYG